MQLAELRDEVQETACRARRGESEGELLSDHIEVSFSTTNPREIPRVGQRKRVRVNGRAETKYVRQIEVRAWKMDGEPTEYVGKYVLCDDQGLWR